jgi:hypothetical protein
MIELNAEARLMMAGNEIIAPSESFRGENRTDLSERQGQSFKKRAEKSQGVKPKKIKSASTLKDVSPVDTADVMYAVRSTGAQTKLCAHFRLLADRLMTEDDPLTTQMEDASSTSVAENPFPVEEDYGLPTREEAESTHEENTFVEVDGTSTHGPGMTLESAPSSDIEAIFADSTHEENTCIEADSTHMDDTYCARSTHGMDKHRLVEQKREKADATHGGNTAWDRLIEAVDPGSTAMDGVLPQTRIVGPDIDENYLNVRGKDETTADTNPDMFGNATQPLPGIGG